MNLIYVPSYVAAVVRSQFILGAEAFMGGTCVYVCMYVHVHLSLS